MLYAMVLEWPRGQPETANSRRHRQINMKELLNIHLEATIYRKAWRIESVRITGAKRSAAVIPR